MTYKKEFVSWIGPSESEEERGFIEDCFVVDAHGIATDYLGCVEQKSNGVVELHVPDIAREEMVVVGEYSELETAKEALARLIESNRHRTVVDTDSLQNL